MPELLHVHDAAKVRAFGPPAALDLLPPLADALSGRIAPDEVLILGRPGAGPGIAATLEDALAAHGPGALVVDHTDGWSCFALVGEGLEEVFGRLTHIPLPEAGDEPVFLMGRICDVTGRIFVRSTRIDILTGAEASDHVLHRIEEALTHASRREVVVR